MVGPADAPVGVGDELARAIDDARVAVDELGVAELGQQRLELVRMPEVVLVGHRDVLRGLRRQRERPLEVVVEVAPPRRARYRETRVALNRGLEGGEALGRRAVVADHAHPVGMSLGADRIELAPQQLLRWVEGGHADRHERPGRRVGRRQVQRLSGRTGDRYARELLLHHGPVLQARAQSQHALVQSPLGRHPHHAPEATAKAAQPGILERRGIAVELGRLVGVEAGMHGLEHVAAGHSGCHGLLRLPIQGKDNGADTSIRAEAPAAYEQRGAVPHRQVLRQGIVETHL